MKEAGTHFEQVPRAVVEKILAQQDRLLEKDSEEDGASDRLEDLEAFEPAFRSSKP